MKTQKFALSVMAVSLLAAISSAFAADDPQKSPFTIPMHLAENQLTETQTLYRDGATKYRAERFTDYYGDTKLDIKPNVMLLIDDSGSMSSSAGDSNRAKQVTSTLLEVLDKPNPSADINPTTGERFTYAESAKWGVFWMNNNDDIAYADYRVANTNVWTLTDNSVEDVKASARNMVTGGNTPLAASYIRATQKLADNIKYRCDRNFLVFFGDGYPEGYVRVPMSVNASPIWSNFPQADQNNNLYYYRSADLFRLGDYLHDRDLKTFSKDGTDDAGVSWDDPLYPEQKITTFIITGWEGRYDNRTGDYPGNGEQHHVNMAKMATKNFRDGDSNPVATSFYVTNQEQIRNAFSSIFSALTNNPAANGAPGEPLRQDVGSSSVSSDDMPYGSGGGYALGETSATYAPTNPNITGSQGELVPNEAATVYLHPTMTSAELRFFNVNKNKVTNSTESLVGGAIEDIDLNSQTALTPIYTHDVLVSNGRRANGTPNVQWAGLLSRDKIDLNNEAFAIGDNGKNTDEWMNALMPWMARIGNDADIANQANITLSYRERETNASYGNTRLMGDVIHSNVVSIGQLNKLQAGQDSRNQRQEFLITQANDGMNYIFVRNDDPEHPYRLELNYLPTRMVRADKDDTVGKHYKDIAHAAYASENHPHLYMMDGSIVAQMMKLYTTGANGQSNAKFTVYMIGNMGRGARGVYALNLKEGDTSYLEGPIAKQNLQLFEKTGGDEEDKEMGYTLPDSAMGRLNTLSAPYTDSAGNKITGWTNDVHLASFVASGYYNPQKGRKETESALYIYRTLSKDAGTEANGAQLTGGASAGDLIKKISVGNTGGLSAPTLLDVNIDGIVDFAYAGDYAGNMYRFDVRDMSNITYTKIYEPPKTWKEFDTGKTDENGNPIKVELPVHPITSAPAIARHDNGNYVIVFGTGSDMYEEDIDIKEQQAVYGIYQAFDSGLNPIGKKDTAITAGTVVDDGMNTLLTQTLSDAGVTDKDGNGGYRKVSNNPINKDDQSIAYPGWKLLLDSSNGERVVVKPGVVLGSIEVMTRWYTKGTTSKGEAFVPPPACTDGMTTEECNALLEENERQNAENGWTLSERGPQEVTSSGRCSQNAADNADGWGDWGPEQQVTPSTSVGNDPCVAKVTATTMQDRFCTLEWRETSYYKRTNSDKNKANSALIQISSHNGGAILQGRIRSEALSFIDFVPGEYATYDNGGVGYLASKTFSGIMSVTWTGGIFLSATDLDGAKVASNTTLAGDTGGSGQLLDLGNNQRPTFFNLMSCSMKDDNWGATGTGVSTEGESLFIKAKGAMPLCSVKRISWREVF